MWSAWTAGLVRQRQTQRQIQKPRQTQRQRQIIIHHGMLAWSSLHFQYNPHLHPIANPLTNVTNKQIQQKYNKQTKTTQKQYTKQKQQTGKYNTNATKTKMTGGTPEVRSAKV